MARFTGKRILITGGTSGIGRAGAQRLVAEGAEVTVTGTRPDRIADATHAIPGVRAWRDDAGDPETGNGLAALVEQEEWRLDGLWLNAGYAEIGGVEDITAEQFDRMMAVNVRGPFLQLAALGPYLTEGASVVVTSSTSVIEGSSLAALYAATKGALEAAARGWSAALAGRGIRVNTLVPGATDTDFRRFMNDDTKRSFESDVISRVPLSRSGRPEEVAAVACFLLSDDASYVTGSRYYVDGGLGRV